MKTNNIIIVGGGSAGWMTAATLIKSFPNKKITLIESPKIETIGVGESTIGFVRYWTHYLGIKDEEFFKATDATYKLSIRFENFYKKETEDFIILLVLLTLTVIKQTIMIGYLKNIYIQKHIGLTLQLVCILKWL
jgi:ribulose 1,5-bisphosphate synthetase/thiazole synthase